MNTNDRHLLTQVGLIIVGDEILIGRRMDKHFPRARTFFAEHGVDIASVCYLGDDLDRLADHFRAIRRRGEDCFTFGGIGATHDDRTRQAMALAHGVGISRHPEAVRLLEHQFGDEAYPNRILMAELPEGAELIPNPHNNIPGFSIGRIHCLPGFPEMAWPMVEWVIGHRYETAPGARPAFRSLVVSGARESELIVLLGDAQERCPEVKISSLPRFPQDGQWQIELGVRGDGAAVEAAATLLRQQLLARGFAVDDGR